MKVMDVAVTVNMFLRCKAVCAAMPLFMCILYIFPGGCVLCDTNIMTISSLLDVSLVASSAHFQDP